VRLPSPEALVRLRRWIYWVLIATLAVAFSINLLAILLAGFDQTWVRMGLSGGVVAVACFAALGAIEHGRLTARTGPAVIGLALAGAAALLGPVSVWLEPEDTGDGRLLPTLAAIAFACAACWGGALMVLSLNLRRRLRPIQHATAIALVLLALSIVIPLARGGDTDPDWQLAGVLSLLSLFGILLTSILVRAREAGLHETVAMAHVASVPRSAAFYGRLGFAIGNSFTPPGVGEPSWARLESPGGAKMMIARASEPVVPAQQAVLFYLYCDDLPARHGALQAAGVEVGPIMRPFYAPRGEFRVTDPDGYVLLITHA